MILFYCFLVNKKVTGSFWNHFMWSGPLIAWEMTHILWDCWISPFRAPALRTYFWHFTQSQLDFHFSSFILPHSFAIYLSTFSINPTISQPQPQHSHSTINTIKSILKYQIDLLHIFCLVRSTPKFVFSSSQLTWFSHSCRLLSSSPSPVSAHSISLPLHDPMLVISSLFIFYCLCSNLFLLSVCLLLFQESILKITDSSGIHMLHWGVPK